MSETKAILAIVGGCAMIILAFCIKQFYAGKGIWSASLSNRQIPTWLGRVLFILIGSTALFIGIRFLVANQ